jgi:hypothetical protein
MKWFQRNNIINRRMTFGHYLTISAFLAIVASMMKLTISSLQIDVMR